MRAPATKRTQTSSLILASRAACIRCATGAPMYVQTFSYRLALNFAVINALGPGHWDAMWRTPAGAATSLALHAQLCLQNTSPSAHRSATLVRPLLRCIGTPTRSRPLKMLESSEGDTQRLQRLTCPRREQLRRGLYNDPFFQTFLVFLLSPGMHGDATEALWYLSQGSVSGPLVEFFLAYAYSFG